MTCKLFTVAAALLVATACHTASASLVTNGTFDTDLAGWTQSGDIGTYWDNGTAHLGRPGTPGTSMFSQDVSIPTGAGELLVKFDYQWQVNQPALTDIFEAVFSYTIPGGGTTEILLTEPSDNGSFGTTVPFSARFSLIDLEDVPNNGTIKFTLTENNSPVGTRIQLDNVSVNVVPEVTSLVTWSVLAGLGLLYGRRLVA